MLKELFRIPGLDYPIYSYSLMLVIGVFCAIWVAQVLARRKGMNPEVFVNAGLLALLSGVLGARISHVLENFHEYFGSGTTLAKSLSMALNLREGGLTYYGGFLLAFPVLVIYAIRKKVSVRIGMDIIAPCLMIGLAFGRIGCFLNGCCYGQEYGGVCAVSFPYYSDPYRDQVAKGEVHPPSELLMPDKSGQMMLIPPELAKNEPELQALMAQQHALPVHPTELYSSATAFVIAALLLAFFTMNKVPGHVFALMLIIEPITRFLLEMLRVEPAVLGKLSLSMVLAIPQFILGIVLWIAFDIYHKRHAPETAAA